MATQLIIPRQLDANGDAASGAKALVYETGTTTPVAVYTDTGLSVAHASPIEADSAGYFAQAFYGGSTALKVVVTDSADATLVTYDPVPLVSLSSSAASDVTFAATTEIPQTNVQAAIVAVEAKTIATADIADDAVTDAKVLNPSGLVFIESQDASASATLDFTGFDATKYDSYVFKLLNVTAATDGATFVLQTSTDGGSTYDAGVSDYRFSSSEVIDGGTATASGSTGAVVIRLTPTGKGLGTAAGEEGWSGSVEVLGPHLARKTIIKASGGYYGATGDFYSINVSGANNNAADVDAIRFSMSSGNIASGTITMYGLRNS